MRLSKYKLITATLAAISLTAVSCTTNNNSSFNEPGKNIPQEQKGDEQRQLSKKSVEFANYNPIYRFSASIPEEWLIEYVPAIESLNIYDPRLPGDSVREKSQIFIRYFRANDFLTLSTVDIFTRNQTQIGGHDAVRYEIQKKAEVPNFPEQPSFRNSRHKLIDIRYTRNSPSTFFVIAYNPALPEEDFETFLKSIVFHNDVQSFKQPLDNAANRVTKKAFGTYVTPQNSPVQPERFRGWHTGTDYEIFEDEASKDVPVYAICGGPILRKQNSQGYGGVMVQSCDINNMAVTVVYGHLNLASIEKNIGDYLLPGQTIGLLGQGFSHQTDGERKHLHLSIHKGNNIDLRGYVQNQSQLEDWLDFQKLLQQ